MPWYSNFFIGQGHKLLGSWNCSTSKLGDTLHSRRETLHPTSLKLASEFMWDCCTSPKWCIYIHILRWKSATHIYVLENVSSRVPAKCTVELKSQGHYWKYEASHNTKIIHPTTSSFSTRALPPRSSNLESAWKRTIWKEGEISSPSWQLSLHASRVPHTPGLSWENVCRQCPCLGHQRSQLNQTFGCCSGSSQQHEADH